MITKPCPKCGGKATVERIPHPDNGRVRFRVRCAECPSHCITNKFFSRRMAVKYWNSIPREKKEAKTTNERSENPKSAPPFVIDFNKADKATVYRMAIIRYGREAQIDKAIEEMSELTKALLKHRVEYSLRGRSDSQRLLQTYNDVAEEIVDVQIMLEQLKILYEYNERVENEKLNRLWSRLEILGNEGKPNG